MKTTEIRRLIDPARNDDKDAHLTAIELAERLLLEQEPPAPSLVFALVPCAFALSLGLNAQQE